MTDRFRTYTILLNDPCNVALDVGADDANTFTQPSRYIYVGAAGNLNVRFVGYDDLPAANSTLMANVQPGEYAWRVDRIYATGTTIANNFLKILI